MRYGIIISFTVIVIAGALTAYFGFQLQPEHYTLEIQGMKETYEPGEEFYFYYTLTGFGNTCHSFIVSFPNKNGDTLQRGEAIDCHRPSNKELDYDSRKALRQYTSNAPMIPGVYNVTVKLGGIEPQVYEFTVTAQERNIGYTPAFEYHRTVVNGTTAQQICQMIGISCPKNPEFNAINRHDKNFTYFYHVLSEVEYLVKVEGNQICYTTDDVQADITGEFEHCEIITQCNEGFKEINGQCKQIGKIREKDIPVFFHVQLMALGIEWNLQDRTWANPDFEIEPSARVCSAIIKESGAAVYISTVWQDQYNLSDMKIHREMPDDCVKFLPIEKIR